tara:strand:- start:1439 stop:2992 length:1554 start_codon:yes stop_codon:yes gene_type:complete
MPNYLYKNYFLGSIFLIFISFLAHFFIFERYSVGPDDYEFFLMKEEGWRFFLIHPDRPFQYIWFQLQNSLVGIDGFRGLLLIFFSSSLTILASFLFLRVLTKNNSLSFLLSLIYVLLIHKLEVFHYPVNAHVNLSSSLYIFSLYFFIRYFDNFTNLNLYLSIIFYSFGLFWYEVGFFLPLIMLSYMAISKKEYILNRKIILFGSFLLFIVIFYSVYRISGAFGFAQTMAGRSISLQSLPGGFIDVFHIFVGRSFIRSALYGFYLFFQMSYLMVFLLLLFNSITVGILYHFFKEEGPIRVDKQLISFFILLILLTVIPNILVGSIGGRNTIISSIGISYLVLLLIFSFKKFSKYLLSLFIFLCLIIGQGNSWAQVVSSKINGSVFNVLSLKKEEIAKHDYVLIDTKSFADNIEFSFLSRDYNVLNTYYGAQTFEDWGLKSMVKISQQTFNNKPKVFISTSDIIERDSQLYFYISNLKGYRSIEKEEVNLDKRRVFLINFDLVFKDNNKSIEKKFNKIL